MSPRDELEPVRALRAILRDQLALGIGDDAVRFRFPFIDDVREVPDDAERQAFLRQHGHELAHIADHAFFHGQKLQRFRPQRAQNRLVDIDMKRRLSNAVDDVVEIVGKAKGVAHVEPKYESVVE